MSSEETMNCQATSMLDGGKKESPPSLTYVLSFQVLMYTHGQH